MKGKGISTSGGGAVFIAAIVIGCLMIGVGMAQGEVPPGCPADIAKYWRLDETGSPAFFLDSVSGTNATCTTCPSPVAGAIGGAQQFGAATDLYAAYDGSLDWAAAASFSVEFWMKTDPASTCAGNQVIVGRDDSVSQLHWWVGCWNGTGVAAFRLKDNAGGPAGALLGTKDLTDGDWHHVAAVRDGAAGTSKIYVDGQLEGSHTYTYTSGFGSDAVLDIGWLNLDSGFHFSGMIDEVAIYQRALSEVEIRSHYYLVRQYCGMCATPVRIMPLGDSITRGNSSTITDNNLMTSYRQKLYNDLVSLGYNVDFAGSLQSGGSASPSFDIDHEGHSGYFSSQITTGVYDWLGASPPDVVLLHIGTNDISAGHDISGVANEVGGILNEIDRYSTDIPVVLARIISRTDGGAAQTTALNDAVQTMADTRIAWGDRILIVDQENALSYPGDMDGDLHPNESGYQKIANVWLNSLVNIMPVCIGQIAPLIISTPITSAMVGQPYSYDVNASGNPAPVYTLQDAPPAMTIDANTGLLQWTPGASGTFSFKVQASNTAGSNIQDITINVAEVPYCTSGMSHYWRLDETSGAPYDDFFGTSNAACSVCPSPATGIIGGAQQFSAATNVYVTRDGTLDWAAAASFSIEFWMKTDPASTCAGNQVIVGRDDPVSQLHWWVGCWNGTGAAAFRLKDNGGGPADAVMGTKDLTDGNWHHVVAVRDGATGTSSLYVDGQLEGSQTYSYTAGFDSTAGMNIGWLNLDSGFHFAGSIDEVAIYQKALSGAEVQQHYSDGPYNIGYCDPPAPPSIISTPVTSVVVGQAYVYDVNATGNPVPTFSLTTWPLGMITDEITGVISWTPAASGSFQVTVQAANGVGSPATQSFTIQVNQGPQIVSTAVTSALAGQPYTYDVNATGSPAPTYSLAVWPEGMVINSSTGLIEWTPAAVGTYPVTVWAGNGIGSTAVQSFDLVVEMPLPSCTNGPVWLGGLNYKPSIQSAYESLTQDAKLMINACEIAGNLDFGPNSIEVTLEGGYDCEFSNRNGSSTISGTATITAATVVFDGITIK